MMSLGNISSIGKNRNLFFKFQHILSSQKKNPPAYFLFCYGHCQQWTSIQENLNHGMLCSLAQFTQFIPHYKYFIAITNIVTLVLFSKKNWNMLRKEIMKTFIRKQKSKFQTSLFSTFLNASHLPSIRKGWGEGQDAWFCLFVWGVCFWKG